MTSCGSDGEVMAKAVDDPRAFTAIFERHFSAIHRYLARRIGTDAADDLAAGVFRVALERRASFRPDTTDARPWLYGIATTLLRRHRRREVRRLRAIARMEGPDPRPDVASDMSEGLIDADIAAALHGLRGDDRDAVLLYACADLTYEDVADALGIPVGTVRSRLHRARRQLRRSLSTGSDDEGADDDG